MFNIAEFWYLEHYRKEISSHLSDDVKEDVAKRISELTLRAPIWLDKDKDYSKDFPELKPYTTTAMTGLYLVAIMKGIVADLQKQ